MVRVSSRAGVERDLYLCDWNVIARYNTGLPSCMDFSVQRSSLPVDFWQGTAPMTHGAPWTDEDEKHPPE
jgi:hypothetical protein